VGFVTAIIVGLAFVQSPVSAQAEVPVAIVEVLVEMCDLPFRCAEPAADAAIV
jgi:hypothetical protein